MCFDSEHAHVYNAFIDMILSALFILTDVLRFLHKPGMKEECEHIFKGKTANEVDLKEVYTELFITEVDVKDVSCEHEILMQKHNDCTIVSEKINGVNQLVS